MLFRDRSEAGWLLARRLARYAPLEPLVLALPPGGVPVALEVARTLRGELDVVVVGELKARESGGATAHCGSGVRPSAR